MIKLFLLTLLIFQTAQAVAPNKNDFQFFVTIGDKSSAFKLVGDHYEFANTEGLKKTGVLNDEDYNYILKKVKITQSYKSENRLLCSRKYMEIQNSQSTIASCLRANDPLAKSLTELSELVNILVTQRK